MNGWISIFWAACALMACWSFSLLVRWVSESVARKRKRLASKYSKRAAWLALALMVVCAGVSVGCGYIALDLHYAFNDGSNPWVNSATVIGWSVGVFGVFMVVWWVVGDRARGRVRCPKCWYDMSAAVEGENGLQCPECGKTVKSVEMFGKTRRARWMMVVALVMMGGGWYGVSVGPRVAETGEWLAAVPTWVLMLGWEVLPEEWIYYDKATMTTPYKARLSSRIDDRWVSDRRLRGFGRRLCQPMMGSLEARWDPKRQALLTEFREVMVYSGERYTAEGRWHDPPVDADRLLLLVCNDLIDGVELADRDASAANPVLEQMQHGSAYTLARSWILWREDEREYQRSPGMFQRFGWRGFPNSVLRETLEPLRERASSPAFGRGLLRHAYGYQYRDAVWLIADTLGLYSVHIDALLSLEEDPELMHPRSRHTYFARYSAGEPIEDIEGVFEQCSRWLRSGDSEMVAHGLSVLSEFQTNHLLDDSTEHAGYLECMELVMSEGLGDRTKVSLGWKGSATVHHLSLICVTNHDSTGATAYPLLLPFIENTDAEAPSTHRHRYTWEDSEIRQDVGLWIDTFGGLVESDDPMNRYWVAQNIPNMKDSVFDDELDRIALQLARDESEYVADEARKVLRQRGAEDLLYTDD